MYSVFFSLLLVNTVVSLLDFSHVHVEITHISGNSFVLQLNIPSAYYPGWFINIIASKGEDGILPVGTGFSKAAEKILYVLRRTGNGEIKFIRENRLEKLQSRDFRNDGKSGTGDFLVPGSGLRWFIKVF